MIVPEDCSSRTKRISSLKERDVKHFRIDDVKTLYELYEFKEEIGHGSFGIVVSAIEKSTSRNFAIKIVNKFSTGATQLQEIKREIKILKTVIHPNIINLDKIYESTKKIYMVFERCRDNLYNVYKIKKPFSEKICRKLIKQLSSAVYYLHKHDIVHRDIKLENILITTNPEDITDEYFIKLTDFGLSIIKSGAGIRGLLKDRCGTMLYMPPEILLEHTYSELCDIWSIGIILYTLVFGKFPFYATDEGELIDKICHAEPDYGTKQISNDAQDLLKLLLKKDPVKRCTALEILKHPWLFDHKHTGRKNETIIDYMKKWKSEMMLPGAESDWMMSLQPSEVTIKTMERNENASTSANNTLNNLSPTM